MKNETTLDPTPTVRQLADRLRNAEAALAEVQAEHATLVADESTAILRGEDPSKLRARIAAAAETAAARLRAVEVLAAALEEARERDQPAAIRTYSLATTDIQTRVTADLDQIVAKLKGLLTEAGAVLDKQQKDLHACAQEHREAFGVEPGSRWAIDFTERSACRPCWVGALRESLPRE